jgi:hypothetical protein
MTMKIPAFSDISGRQEVIVLEENPDGTFRVTPSHPLGLLERHVEGLGSCIGQLIPRPFDREEHVWTTPTVKCKTGKEYSYYQYLRDTLNQKKLIIALVPERHGSVHKFDMHELKFTHDTSYGVQSRIMSKYTEAAELRFKEEAPRFYARMNKSV